VKVGVALLVLALLLPSTALAKGPTEATITGPGLEEPLKLGGRNALAPGEPLEVLANRGGFFEVAWGTDPGKRLAKSPTTRLGPRYRVTYLLPGPSGTDDRIRQDLYPFARGGPVTYTARGQRFFDTRRTLGGWFRAAPGLKAELLAAGLSEPARAAPVPAPAADHGGPWTSIGLVALVAALLAGAAAFAIRRRVRPASA
jgi:hypothetical protein